MNFIIARFLTVIGLAAFTVLLALSPADAAKKKRDPAKRLYMTKTCIACHGRNGAKAIMDYPNLAGQSEKYMLGQIKDIIAGKRTGSPDATGNPRSQGMRGALVAPDGAITISDKDIKTIVKWLAKQTPPEPAKLKTPLDPKSVAVGKKLYKKKCRSCHGKNAMKPLKGYPIIAGQKRAYIVTQVKDIQSKARKNGKSKTMYPMIKKLKDTEINAVADYLSQIDRTK
ncbi:MAG: c-type cytochrome [Rhodospirillales bacterium]|nr:c-type cytochrome [Rhodospirillales bacterium]